MNLLIGLPGDRPGGLILTVLYFFASGLGALLVGFVYGAIGAVFPRASLPLQAASAILRGVPLLLLAFLLAHLPHLSLGVAGLVALLLYSFSHVGEVLRSFMASYPTYLSEQARLVGLGAFREWLQLRGPWTLWRAWQALLTHWVSLLKDTGALVVLGVGELTTVAKMLSETSASYERWVTVLVVAAAMYLAATLALIRGLRFAPGRLGDVMRSEEARA
jgi:ABC-type amino acid transport system permease subunit